MTVAVAIHERITKDNESECTVIAVDALKQM